MTRDIIILGSVIGLLADAMKLAANYILFQMGFTRVVFWQITATRFVSKTQLSEPGALLIGAIADISVTAVLGILFLYLVCYIGRKYLWLKGAWFGLLVWVTLFGTLLGQSVEAKLPQDIPAIIVTIVAHLVFGLALTFFLGLLDPDHHR